VFNLWLGQLLPHRVTRSIEGAGPMNYYADVIALQRLAAPSSWL
jgi:hypothetical protein